MLTIYNYTEFHIQKYIASGANAYLSKNCDYKDLVRAVQNVITHNYHFDNNVSMKMIQKMIDGKLIAPKFLKHDPLSRREIEVLEMICAQKTGPEIAEILDISIRTVENHKENLKKKTGAKNGVGLCIYAIIKGIYKLDI